MTITPVERGTGGAAAVIDPYRIMVVDDSAVIRGLLARTIETDENIKVVATASNGEMAISTLRRYDDVDVIILDIEMPVMDGLTALPELIAIAPDVKIIMASTLTRRNADISLRCLSNGADDYIPKPTSNREVGNAEEFKRELVSKVRALAEAKRGMRRPRRGALVAAQPKAEVKAAPIGLRQPSPITPAVIAIGSSTGGPQALFAVFDDFADKIHQPILITQHMPPTFTTILAEHIERVSGRKCTEVVDGEPFHGDRIYIAPGNYHTTVTGQNGTAALHLDDGPRVNYCRPSVDPMLRSLAASYGPRVLAIILTGMGKDGLQGCEAVTEAGGTVIAQDEDSSVVWGMPGAVATAGLCSAVLPLAEIGAYVTKLAMGSSR